MSHLDGLRISVNRQRYPAGSLMKIFLARSGPASRELALLLYNWLPDALPAIDPFMSDGSIRSGQCWFNEIGKQLQTTRFAILRVTPTNRRSTWMHFEAGAVSKQMEETRELSLQPNEQSLQVRCSKAAAGSNVIVVSSCDISCRLAPGNKPTRIGQMRALKKILIGFGVLLLMIGAFVSWLSVSSSYFRKEHTHFVETFIADLSKRWDIDDVHDRIADAVVSKARSPEGQHLLHQLAQLGALKSIRDVELRGYRSHGSEKTGYFSLRGTFENGEAEIELTIIENSGTVRVAGFYVDGAHLRGGAVKLRT